jgi:hypothetical protein
MAVIVRNPGDDSDQDFGNLLSSMGFTPQPPGAAYVAGATDLGPSSMLAPNSAAQYLQQRGADSDTGLASGYGDTSRTDARAIGGNAVVDNYTAQYGLGAGSTAAERAVNAQEQMGYINAADATFAQQHGAEPQASAAMPWGSQALMNAQGQYDAEEASAEQAALYNSPLIDKKDPQFTYGLDIIGAIIDVATAGSASPFVTAAIAGATTAATTAANNVATDQATTFKNTGVPAIMAAVGAGVGKEVAPLAQDLSDATELSQGVSTGIVKAGAAAGTNALGAALTGGNIGNAALMGAATSGVSSAVSGGLGMAGIGTQGIDNSIGKLAGNYAGGLIGGALNGGATGGSSATGTGNTMALNATSSPYQMSNIGNNTPIAGDPSPLAGLTSNGSTINTSPGLFGNTGSGVPSQIESGVAYTGQGMATTGMGMSNAGYDSYATGNSSPLASFGGVLGGAAPFIGAGLGYNNASTQGSMQNNAYTSAGVAGNSGNQFGVTGIGGQGSTFNNGQLNLNAGGLAPAAQGFGQFAGSQSNMANMYGQGGVPAGVQNSSNAYMGNLANAQGYAGAGQLGGLGVMGMGMNTMGSANANYNTAYQNALTAGQGVLNPMIQQQSNALLNSNFERGMSGTSGGALQTQALQNSFNTAELQNQQQAVGQANTAYMNTNNVGLGQYNAGAGQMGNFNAQSANLGLQGYTNQTGLAAFSPQLAGLYNQNAASGVTGFNGITSGVLAQNQAGQAGVTNQGNQMNAAAKTMGGIGQGYQGSSQSYLSSLLGSPGAVSNLGAGASSLLNSLGLGGLFGNNSGNGLGTAFSGTNLANNSNAFNAYNAANGPTSGDISSLTGGAGTLAPLVNDQTLGESFVGGNWVDSPIQAPAPVYTGGDDDGGG